jgi:hypothetical protein
MMRAVVEYGDSVEKNNVGRSGRVNFWRGASKTKTLTLTLSQREREQSIGDAARKSSLVSRRG